MSNSRAHKSLLNIKVGLFFYLVGIALSFFSRKIFLDCLGTDFIGLSGTLQNILELLNLAELGIGLSISYFLFKPIQEKNQEQIMEIISVFGYLYRKIGFFITISGIVISFSFPFIFKGSVLNMGIIYFSFYSYLGSSLIGYFINYREILLSADQKNYLVTVYFQTAGFIKVAIQILFSYYSKNLYIWVFIEFLFSIISCIVLNWKINKEYPWLKTTVKEGKNILHKYPEIVTKTKQVFIHKIADFFLRKSDSILVFSFVSLKMVAFYGNYTLIISKLMTLMDITFDGIGAGVGNLIAEGDKKKIMSVFWELMSVRYFISGIMFFSLYHLTEPFIRWWLGNEYILDHNILILLLVNLFIMQTRGIVDIYNRSLGRFADTWSAWVEVAINLTVTLLTAVKWGITGILLGKIISTGIIISIWKPYYLFKGLNISVKTYWKEVFKYYGLLLISFILISLCIPFVPFSQPEGIFQLLIFSACIVCFFSIVYFALLYIAAAGLKNFMCRFSLFNRIFGLANIFRRKN
jgi:O-antigen/teichoic acid export membrane protein